MVMTVKLSKGLLKLSQWELLVQ